MRLAAKTDGGKVRSENQDDYRASLQNESCAWAAVCDGMGGANGGSTASGLAVSLVQERCASFSLEDCTNEQLRKFAKQLVEDANTLVYRAAQQQPALHGMGTTMVLVLVNGTTCCAASVGDSRIYLYRNERLQQITRDHSMVQDLVEKGVITQLEAESHPQKNVITRAVGIQPQVEVDLFDIRLQPKDVLLLCSDGLTNALKEPAIEGILSSTAFYGCTEQLVAQVLAREEQDNTTVVLLSVD